MSNTNQNNSQPIVPNFDTVDGRYLTRTNRTVHFATKVTPEFNQNIRRLAHEQHCLITEMLEKFMNAYFELEELKKEKKAEKNILSNKTKKEIKLKDKTK